jgi:hypothetical protein
MSTQRPAKANSAPSNKAPPGQRVNEGKNEGRQLPSTINYIETVETLTQNIYNVDKMFTRYSKLTMNVNCLVTTRLFLVECSSKM